MFYLSGNTRNKLLGVVDTNDEVEEFYTRDYLKSLNIPILGLNSIPKVGFSFRDKCFIYTLVEIEGKRGWALKARPCVYTFRSNRRVAGFSVISLNSCFENTIFETANFLMDTSDVIDMSYAFFLSSVEDLDLHTFNTINVKDMSNMFNSCNRLKHLDLTGFNTSNVVDMSHMFDNCRSLTNLDLSSFNTHNVVGMTAMFNCCTNLLKLDLSMFDTSRVQLLSEMFKHCSSLEFLDLSSFRVSSNIELRDMFVDCFKLQTLDLSGFDLSNKLPYFLGCTSLYILKVGKVSKDNFTFINIPILLVPKDSGLSYTKVINLEGKTLEDLVLRFRMSFSNKKVILGY